MPINPNRISADIDSIAAFTESPPTTGHSRPTFSPPWKQACDYIIAQAHSANCQTRIDPFGNLHARPKSIPWDKPIWLSGSHIDSVPTGGKFDGVAGIVAALEILRTHKDIPLELIIFAEEEGTTFGLGMLGSRAWIGELTPNHLAKIYNSANQNYLEAGQPHGVHPENFIKEKLSPFQYLGLIEIHIEQGPSLWNANKPLAIVNAIAGRNQYRAAFHGTPNHAGSTSMLDRFDALAAASTVVVQIEALAKELSPQTVATVGRLNCRPNAINVIPGEVDFTIDFRSPDPALLTRGDQQIQQLISKVAKDRRLTHECFITETQPAVALNAALCDRLKKIAGDVPIMASGALHDAAIIAPHIPTAMIFVASKDGISHNPAEFSRVEDIAAAAQILSDMISAA
jgi:hydantoinase/carbamoylase family amidase